MCRDRRRHYDDGFMRVVADLIRGEKIYNNVK